MAQLHARGELALGEAFVNESLIGTRFTGRLVEETHVGGLRGRGARDHRPRVDDRRGAVPARGGRPLPGRLRAVRPREVAVVGAGIVGTATARELAVRGVDVVLLDAGEVSGGTTGLGEGNVLCSDKDGGPELELCLRGRELFDELDERLGDEARIRRKGALIVHPDEVTWAAEPARLERLRGRAGPSSWRT